MKNKKQRLVPLWELLQDASDGEEFLLQDTSEIPVWYVWDYIVDTKTGICYSFCISNVSWGWASDEK